MFSCRWHFCRVFNLVKNSGSFTSAFVVVVVALFSKCIFREKYPKIANKNKLNIKWKILTKLNKIMKKCVVLLMDAQAK